MNRRLLCFLMSLLLMGSAYAQTRKITGKVTTVDDGSLMPGVSVIVPGTRTGTTTSADGAYNLNVPAGTKSLAFSFVGFVTKRVDVSGDVVNVVLTPDENVLNEVVVTAGGLTAQRRELGNQATTIK